MPGVKTGDLGPKFGFNSKDNAWCTFDHVRVPRNQLLQKIQKVDREGNLTIEGNPKVLYAGMLRTRM